MCHLHVIFGAYVLVMSSVKRLSRFTCHHPFVARDLNTEPVCCYFWSISIRRGPFGTRKECNSYSIAFWLARRLRWRLPVCQFRHSSITDIWLGHSYPSPSATLASPKGTKLARNRGCQPMISSYRLILRSWRPDLFLFVVVKFLLVNPTLHAPGSSHPNKTALKTPLRTLVVSLPAPLLYLPTSTVHVASCLYNFQLCHYKPRHRCAAFGFSSDPCQFRSQWSLIWRDTVKQKNYGLLLWDILRTRYEGLQLSMLNWHQDAWLFYEIHCNVMWFCII